MGNVYPSKTIVQVAGALAVVLTRQVEKNRYNRDDP